jgi:hypothetical protein
MTVVMLRLSLEGIGVRYAVQHLHCPALVLCFMGEVMMQGYGELGFHKALNTYAMIFRILLVPLEKT